MPLSRFSSNARAISCAIRTRLPIARCLTAPLDCVIHLPRRSSAKADCCSAVPAGSRSEKTGARGSRMADWGRGQDRSKGRVGTWDAFEPRRRALAAAASVPDFGRAFAERLRNWAIADTGPGRLLPWLPVAFGLGIAMYFAADREPAWW